ncbi:zinc finger, CCHC-type, Retrotransposon gag domain protein [Artemisia annua]|uniref:Zinc finger, CCHC-type, Retrotransposon gag domain protein n=1 Tax=Artemisia annua TaxID=35608 RepID=A0A2U1MZ40_ARTAN|nr:zinc finger, CCHC-type, Retrotransposon gag domain protein [Artemisia annua]
MTQAAVGQFIANNIATDPTEDLTHVEFMGYNPPSFGGTIDTKEFLKWFEEIETIFRCGDCRKEDKVKFATCTFRDHAQEWWTKYVQIVGVDAAYSHSWEKLKRMMSLKFYVKSELQAMGQETLDFTMVGDDVVKYTTRFYELARLAPAMDEPESKKLERYIGGLAPEIRMLVISLEPDTMSKAINMAIEAKEYIAHTKTLGSNSCSYASYESITIT